MQIQIDWTHTITDTSIEKWEVERTDDPTHTPVLIATLPFRGGLSERYRDTAPLPGRNFYRVRGKAGLQFTAWSLLIGPPLLERIVDITAQEVLE